MASRTVQQSGAPEVSVVLPCLTTPRRSQPLFELLKVPVRFRSDNVTSLVRQDPSPDFSLADQLGFGFREFSGSFIGAPSAGFAQTSGGDPKWSRIG